MNKSAHTRAVGLLVLAALCWSLGGLLIKSVTWPPLAVAGGRGLIAALFLTATNRGLRFPFSRLQVYGAVGYALCTVTFCVATKLTTAANAILLQYTAPVWVALFSSWFLHEKSTRADWATIAVVLAGMGLFFSESLELNHLLGNALGALSGIFFAGMTIALRRQKNGSAIESIILGNALAFLIGLPWIIGAPVLSAEGWTSLAILGLVQLGVSYWLYAKAIRHVTALEAVLIPVIEPILNPVWVLLTLGERPTPRALIGGIIVLVAVTTRAWHSIRGRTVATRGDGKTKSSERDGGYDDQRETVVLLHGLGLAAWAMRPIEWRLRRENFRVINLSYPSRHQSLEELGANWLPARLHENGVTQTSPLHFVTHSMGGILLRQWRHAEKSPYKIGRTVMIAPPNDGSAVVDHLRDTPGFHWYLGLNGRRLGLDGDSVPRALGPWPTGAGELGIIAGDRTLDRFFSQWLEKPHDGKVTVASARLEGMRDLRVVHHSHTIILWRRTTLNEVVAFLRTGQFSKIPAAPNV